MARRGAERGEEVEELALVGFTDTFEIEYFAEICVRCVGNVDEVRLN